MDRGERLMNEQEYDYKVNEESADKASEKSKKHTKAKKDGLTTKAPLSDKQIQRRIYIILIALASVVILAVLATLLWRKLRPSKVVAERVFSVAVTTIEPSRLQEYFKVNGSVLADNTTNITPDTNGRLVRYTVRLGQSVTRGAVIGYVDPSRPGAQFNLNPVVAPVAGTITALPVDLGNSVTSATVVAQLGDLTRLKVETYIPERFAKVIALGSTADLFLPAFPGMGYSAVVDEIAPVVDITSRTVQTRLLVTAQSNNLMHGMFGTLNMHSYLHENVVTVAESAIVIRSGRSYLFVMQPVDEAARTEETNYDGTVQMVAIERGATVDGVTLINSGVSFGDIVITEGQNLLTDGARVRFSRVNTLVGTNENEVIATTNEKVASPADAVVAS
jgi:multidrug efflux pump subunit AcrA (membrane-fusion protein)